ncbi:MAG: response regulator [Deltaproteobacteria bacterium]|nr:response regulator [Deltaproteobacteria bacterium]
MKVLIIEKDKTVRQSLSYFIEHQKNCEVFLANSKKEGASLFKSVPFDMVLCGDRLPDGGGLEILKEWMSENPRLISILMTVQSEEGMREEAKKAGVQGFLVKPFDLKQLEEAMGMKSSEFACPDQIGGVRSSELRISGK